MRLFKKKPVLEPQEKTLFQVARQTENPFSMLNSYIPLATPEVKLYESIREGVPLIDSAILKIIRLVGGFTVMVQNRSAQSSLDHFVNSINVDGVSTGLESFIASYLDNLLTYGNSIGELVLGSNQQILGLYNADVSTVQIKPAKTPLELDFYVQDSVGSTKKVRNKQLLLFTALNPKSGEYKGNSILRSLPFVTNILFKIYNSIGQNFDRIGNIRYAVTYKPSGDTLDRAYAKERAQMIAKEWSEGMRASSDGQVRDFITIGDVGIKVIGADNQMIDTQIPVRQMLEQIVAKLGIPPFLLGLSWSTTERMSKQQTDILTTELEFYRRLLTPVITKICRMYLRLNGLLDEPLVEWKTINLKDEVEAAQARLYEAQAAQIMENLTKGGIGR